MQVVLWGSYDYYTCFIGEEIRELECLISLVKFSKLESSRIGTFHYWPESPGWHFSFGQLRATFCTPAPLPLFLPLHFSLFYLSVTLSLSLWLSLPYGLWNHLQVITSSIFKPHFLKNAINIFWATNWKFHRRNDYVSKSKSVAISLNLFFILSSFFSGIYQIVINPVTQAQSWFCSSPLLLYLLPPMGSELCWCSVYALLSLSLCFGSGLKIS
jgi:hypothetical protein